MTEKRQRVDETVQAAAREFSQLADGRYIYLLPSVGLAFQVDRLRRDRHELVGELTVLCEWAGAKRVGTERILGCADWHLSSLRARTDRAKWLASRSNAPHVDWDGLLEEFAVAVLDAEQRGPAPQLLHTYARPEPDDAWTIDGLPLLRRHPIIWFGDGAATKSYLALYVAGVLARQGVSVLYLDWEFAAEDHRDRLERLFGGLMPSLWYLRCDQPLTRCADRLNRLVQAQHIQYLVYDSIAFACDGPPEAAEVASAYFRIVRDLGAGSLHLAHISRGDGGDKRPFGSAFWANGARATWFIARSDDQREASSFTVGLFNRKVNTGPLLPPRAFTWTFSPQRTFLKPESLAVLHASPTFDTQLTVAERMAALLGHTPLPLDDLAATLQVQPNTVRQVLRRSDRFVRDPTSKLIRLR